MGPSAGPRLRFGNFSEAVAADMDMSGDCSVSEPCDNSVAIYEANEDDMETMETETIVEEFVRLKLKQNTGIIQRRRTSTDME
ncbi:unnamed protein product [Trichobilharzia regenti]|nr:unnamed protein product [Trichobilharzia regenti]